MRVRLALEGGQPIAFYAGQYINLLLEDGAKRSFSFATAPGAVEDIELHIRLIPGGRLAVEEAPEGGTRVTPAVPLDSDEPESEPFLPDPDREVSHS